MGSSLGNASMVIDVMAARYRNIDACHCVPVEDRARGTRVQVIEACCDPVLDAPLSEDEATGLAAAFKVLADPARLRLLSLIASSAGAEACACDLVGPLGRSQPTISHHLSVLHGAGLVTREQRGRWAWYRVVPERFAVLRDALATTLVTRG